MCPNWHISYRQQMLEEIYQDIMQQEDDKVKRKDVKSISFTRGLVTGDIELNRRKMNNLTIQRKTRDG